MDLKQIVAELKSKVVKPIDGYYVFDTSVRPWRPLNEAEARATVILEEVSPPE